MLQEMGAAFLDALQPGAEARRLAKYQLIESGDVLPEPDAWAVLGRGDEAALVLLAGELLLTISRESRDEEGSQLVIAAHPVLIAEVTHRREDQRTYWDFRFRDRDPLRVEGRIEAPTAPRAAEAFDQAEAFARFLAARIGWRIGGHEATRDEAEPGDELPGAATSESIPRRQRVTDLWGNPARPRHRNR